MRLIVPNVAARVSMSANVAYVVVVKMSVAHVAGGEWEDNLSILNTERR